ncbi:FadR family transcriptional regulator [Brevibacillus laterosporus]|nr:FadR/GntR family transcriptional regulator [Brevibacillus laterosporus]TPG86969.1 FadR family transcriptional regulator [Brevibacillus laterosporus]
MKLNQPTRLTLVQQVVLQFEQLIESNQWPLGQKIPPEPELVKQLSVSRNTVREAIRALVHSGLLDVRQGDGTYVCRTSELGAVLARRLEKTELRETMEVRYALERQAARLAAHNRTEQDIATLQRYLSEEHDARERGDVALYIEADVKLHKAIVASTHNTLLQELYDSMTDALTRAVASVIDHTTLSSSPVSHTDLVEAIRQQDAGAAETIACSYMNTLQQVLQDAWGGEEKIEYSATSTE